MPSFKVCPIHRIITSDLDSVEGGRPAEILNRFELVYVEMEAGDALFFHANLPHRSDQNRSDKPRWSMICCYNAKSNDPYKESHHPRYTPLAKVADSAIKEVGIKRFAGDRSNVAWMDDAEDRRARSGD